MNKLVKNTSIYALGDIIPRLLNFISLPILTSYLTPSEYGVVNYVNTVNLFLMALGFMSLNTYYLVYYFRVGDKIQQQKLLGNLSIFVIGVNIIFTFFSLLFGSKIFHLFGSNIDFYPYLVIGIITNFFNILGVLPFALYRVQERPLPLTLLNVLKGILSFGLTIFLVIFFQFKALGVLYSNMIVSIIFGVIFLNITYKNMIWNINWEQIKKALCFSLPLLPGSISFYLVSMSDRILIDKYLSLSALGIYGTASSLAMTLNIISSGAYKAFEPHFFKTYGTSTFLPQFVKIRDNFFFLILAGALGISFFAKEFFILFTKPQYYIAYYYIPLILVGIISSSMGMLYRTIITARGNTKINSMITILGGLLSVSLNIILLSRIGIIAACITSIITLGLMFIAAVFYSKVRISHYRIIISLLFSALVVYINVYLINIENIVISILYKSIIYLSLIFLISYILNINLKNIVQNLFKKK